MPDLPEVETVRRSLKNICDKKITQVFCSDKKLRITSQLDLQDLRNTKGDHGNFQNNFKVYGSEKEKCLICKDVTRKIATNGRSSFYCQTCQK